MELSSDHQTRTLQLAAAIAFELGAEGKRHLAGELSPDGSVRTTQLLEAVARRIGLLPPIPLEGTNLATVTTSIGTTGRDYSTITAWEADLDSALYSAGDAAVGECYNDTAFDESVVLNGGGTKGLVSCTITVAAGERHDGTAGSGARISRAATSGSRADIFAAGGGINVDTSLQWLEIHCATGDEQNREWRYFDFFDNSRAVHVSNVLLHGASHYEGGGSYYARLGSNEGAYFHNSIMYDSDHAFESSGTVSGVIVDSGVDGQVLNCTLHDVGMSANGSANVYGVNCVDEAVNAVRNTVVTDTTTGGSGTAACFNPTSFSTATVSHNAASDTSASGTGSIDSITTADQYVSTVGGSEDLHLKTGSDCIDAGTDLGTTPTGVNLDIDGRDRDAEGDTWDIGAHEFVGGGGGGVTLPALDQGMLTGGLATLCGGLG